jgi:hypothetical protein
VLEVVECEWRVELVHLIVYWASAREISAQLAAGGGWGCALRALLDSRSTISALV